MENEELETTEQTGGEEKTEENQDTEISDEELQELPEEVQKRIKTLEAKKNHWRSSAVNPETGKKYKDEIAELKQQGQKKEEKGGDAEKDSLELPEKSYLNSLGYTDPDQQQVVLDAMNSTGKDIETVVNNKFVQSELKSVKDEKEAEEATPSGKGRNAQPGRDSVEYWVQKGELPEKKPENTELRRKVINERQRRAQNATKFGG